MKKAISILCIIGILAGCAGKNAVQPEEPTKVPAETETETEEIKEAEDTKKTETSKKDMLLEAMEIKAEGIDYLSVEGIQVPKGSSLAMIGKDSGSGFWKAVKEGASQAVTDLNEKLGYTGDEKVKLIYDAPEKENVSEQIDIIDQMLDKNPDALCIGFVDINSGKTQLELAKANGIPVLAVDSGIENSLIVSSSKTDNYQAGAEAARKLCESIGDTGKTALLVHSSLTESGIEREKGFLEEIAQNHPNVEVVDIAYSQQDERSVDEIVAAVLQEHPDLKAYFGTNEVVVKALLDALALHKSEDSQIQVAGFDASTRLLRAIEEGKLTGVMAQNPWGMGYVAAVSAFRAMADMENAKVTDTGYYWISAENMNEDLPQVLAYK